MTAGLGAALIAAGPASAAFTGLEVESDPDGAAAGLFVCSVYALFDNPADELVAVAGTPGSPLGIFVLGGNFYQDPEGAPLTAPFSSVVPGVSGLLNFDTFVTIGVREDDLFSPFDNVLTVGLAFGDDRLETIAGSWFILPSGPGLGGIGAPDSDGRVLIFQGSFVEDGVATGIEGHMRLQFTADGLPGQTAYVTFGHQVPGPGALAVLGMAGLLGTRRRRRR